MPTTLSTPVPRYLVAFHPKRIPHYFTDVLVIGSGIAGQRAALAAGAKVSVLITSKESIEQSNSAWAQGGIASVLDPADQIEDHIADTLTAGGPLCDEDTVRRVVEEGPRRVRELIEWGTQFDQNKTNGELLLGREGGHSRNRVAHAYGDATGREIMRALSLQTGQRSNIEFWENSFTIDLLTLGGACRGALVWNRHHGKTLVWAKQTILATGGCGQIYRESTNPSVATGDGHAIGYRAGAQLRDMEFMQFHPTMLYIAGSGRSLITEAMRGEGAYLVDRNGHRFMFDYDERGELAPRDVVSQAIVSQMGKTSFSNVYLDLSHLEAAHVRERFPSILKVCEEFGIDITKDRIPVRPGAHYMIGGITVDADGRTALPGLWAVGEVTSSGLHGANRLASNSLLEGLVYGASAGKGAAAIAECIPDSFNGLTIDNPAAPASREPLDLEDIRNSLKSLMWRSAGVQRDKEGLLEAAQTLDHYCRYVLSRQFAEPQGWELQNMLIVSRIIIEAALQREESRGVHSRSDFPDSEESWLRHQTFEREAKPEDALGRVLV